MKQKKPKKPACRKSNPKPTRRKQSKPSSTSDPVIAKPVETDDAIATEAHLCPYDENLLERSRTQWQFGDWESLARINRDTLQHHPDRAKLALLAAAGHQQTNNMTAAHQFVRLAQDWGCSKKLVSQILIAGVHNTLARAAVTIGQAPRALKHFEAAIAAGAPGSEVSLLTQARIGHQLAQLGLPGGTASLQLAGAEAGASPRALMPSTDETAQSMAEALQKQKEELSAQIKKHQDELVKMRKDLNNTLKKEMLNATKQLEAFLEVQNYLKTGERTGDMHGWPISPDFALYLIELLEANDYDLVIEFGSGTSTVLIAKTLAKASGRRQGRQPVRQVAFEHLEKYYQQTLTMLQQAGLADTVQLVHAPLKPYDAPHGTTYSYYSCHEALAALAQRVNPVGLRILVMVDGPPGSTGKHARYPALPVALQYMPACRMDVLLDDFDRQDETEIIENWCVLLNGRSIAHEKKVLAFEKGACLLSLL